MEEQHEVEEQQVEQRELKGQEVEEQQHEVVDHREVVEEQQRLVEKQQQEVEEQQKEVEEQQDVPGGGSRGRGLRLFCRDEAQLGHQRPQTTAGHQTVGFIPGVDRWLRSLHLQC